ncbi:MAG: signal peptidase I [Flavobacteriales bacterium]
MKPWAIWARIPEWGKAFVIAIGLLLTVHLLVLRWVTVRSTSMYATLLPGDLVGVERWPVWTGFRRGDIAVFHDPLQDDRAMGARQLLVKRIVGLPGDKVELRDGDLFVNNVPLPPWPEQTTSYAVRLRKGADPSALLKTLGLPADMALPDLTVIDLPLNAELAKRIGDRSDVVSVEQGRGASGSPGRIFPYSPNFHWNNDDFGPITVPAKGDSVRSDPFTLPLYDRIISRYEHNKMEVSNGKLNINGSPDGPYVIQQNYYFVLGDSRSNSSDSRYWGFVPADHLVGRAAFVLINAHASADSLLPHRSFKGL